MSQDSESPKKSRRPWEKRISESVKAFEAFACYRDMGPDRSTAKVARELGKTKALMDRWSGRHGWQRRIDAYERYIDERRMNVAAKKREAMIKRHDQAGKAMVALGKQGIDELRKALKKAKRKRKMSPRDIAALVKVGVQIERLSNDEATEKIEETIKPDFSELLAEIRSDPVAMELYRKLLSKRAR